MLIKKKYSRIIQDVAYLGIALVMCFYTTQGSIFFGNVMKPLLYIGVGLCLVYLVTFFGREIFSKKKLGATLACILIGILVLVVTIHIDDTRLAVATIVGLCAINLNTNTMIKMLLVSKLASILIVVVTGGYMHINGFAIHGTVAIALYACMVGKNMSKYDVVRIILGCVLICVVTMSATAMLCLAIFIVMLIFSRIDIAKKIIPVKPVKYIYAIMLLLNIVLAVSINFARFPTIENFLPDFAKDTLHNVSSVIDGVANSRLQLANYSLSNTGFSAFGGNVEYPEEGTVNYFNLDSGYMWLLQWWGVAVSMVFLILTIIAMKSLALKDEYVIMSCMVLFAIWGFSEDILVNFGLNPLWVFYFKEMFDYFGYKKNGKLSHGKK